jgi:hypothetical protein
MSILLDESEDDIAGLPQINLIEIESPLQAAARMLVESSANVPNAESVAIEVMQRCATMLQREKAE